ncbi:nicotinate-nucleotide--dimethylbenzimidazole phosphoribosyltransferase, partial [Streptomyces albidoflavus]
MSALNLDDFSDLIKRPDSTVRRAAEERRERLAATARSARRTAWRSTSPCSPARPT